MAISTAHHLAGTCKMGPAADPMAVVDQYARYGLSGMRVVDAFIMPDVVRANINATIIIMAEPIADWSKKGNRKRVMHRKTGLADDHSRSRSRRLGS